MRRECGACVGESRVRGVHPVGDDGAVGAGEHERRVRASREQTIGWRMIRSARAR